MTDKMRFIGCVFMSMGMSALFDNVFAYTVIPGNSQTPNATFTFPVAQFLGRQDGITFISAAQAGAGDFSVAFLDFFASKVFKPIAHKEITLNYEPATTSPLYDVSVQFLGVVEQDRGGLMAVLNDTTATAYFIESIATNVLSIDGITDAAGNVTSGIISLEGSNKARAFMAVKPAGGEFGDPNSGINVVGVAQQKSTIDGKEVSRTGLFALSQAVQFDKEAPFLGINGAVTVLQQPIPIIWDRDLEFVYIGAGNIEAGSASNGVRSVALGINDIVLLNSFLIRSIFDSNTNFTGLTDNTIIVAGAGEQLSVHHLKSLLTSTNKTCLIVVGGNGAPVDTARSVYAIPLVPFGSFQGLVANKFNTSQQAMNVTQMVTTNDPQALVGGGPLLAGDIASLSVRAETVFVTVVAGDFPGVYYSRPIFDVRGEIKAWSVWARATEITQSSFASSLEFTQNSTLILTSDDPKETNIPNTIFESVWGQGTQQSFGPALDILNGYFPQSATQENVTGMQPVFDIPISTAGLDDVALLAVLGRDRLALVQTGSLQSGVMVPTAGANFIGLMNEDGAMQTTPTDQTILMVEGGAVADIGPLTSCVVAHSSALEDTWVCIAGSHGIAVLQHADGSGCGAAIGSNFSGITQGMSFTIFGDYSFVRKLVVDDGFLYIVTDTTLDRVQLTSDIQQSVITTVAQVPVGGLLSEHDVFNDCIVSNSLALLATSTRLLRIADGSRITDAQPEWQVVSIPEGQIPVMALYPATSDDNNAMVARGIGGHMYVLTGNAYSNLSIINRFAIQGLAEGAAVTSTTVLPFSTDYFIPPTLSYFIDGSEQKDAYATDGASTFMVHNRHGDTPTTVVVPSLRFFPRSGIKWVGVGAQPIDTTVSVGATIASLTRDSASGAWLLAGTMGMRVLE